MEKHEPDYKPYRSKEEERIYRIALLDASKDAFSAVGGADMGGLALCSRARRDVLTDFGIVASSGGLYLQGLQHCHSISCCPVCSYRLGIDRCNEIGSFIWCVRKEKKGVYLVSLTCSHKSKDKLKDLVARLMGASSYMWRDGSLRRLLKSVGYIGRITSFEVMLMGINGVHPHLHILLIADEDLPVDFFSNLLLAEWKKSLNHYGLDCNEHGADCFGYQGVGRYIEKMQTELSLLNVTKNMSKGGSSMSPMNVLVSWDLERKIEYARQWVSFVQSMKGKRITCWSKGLKDYAKELVIKYGLKVEEEIDYGNCLLFLEDSRDFSKFRPWEWRMFVECIYAGKIERVLKVLQDRNVRYYLDNKTLKEFYDVHQIN